MNWFLILSVILALAGIFCSCMSFYYLRKLKRILKEKDFKQTVRFDVEGRVDKKTEAQILAQLVNQWPRGVK